MKKEKKIVRYSVANLPKITEKDRALLEAAERKSVDFDDIPELTTDDFNKAVVMPPVADPAWVRKMDELSRGKKVKTSREILLDDDVVRWFRSNSKDCQASVNAALRLYMLAHDLPR